MLQIHNMCKSFGDNVAVADLTLEARPGEVLGLVGPNGAGKTTTLRMLATLSKPDSGRAFVDGFDVEDDVIEVRRIVGYMPDVFRGNNDMLVWEYLDFYAAAGGLRGQERTRTVGEVLDLTDMAGRRESTVQSLSRGMLQRLCLAKALVNNPKLLLLDEPASGLDPRARIELMALLRALHDMGKTVLISSHILADLAEISDRIAIMEKGRLVVCDTQEALGRRVRQDKILHVGVKSDADRACALLRAMPHVERVEQDGQQLVVTLNTDGENHNPVLHALLDADVPIASFEERLPDLGEVFMQITTGEI